MVQIEEVQRRSNVLGHPSLPCLRRHYTVNLTAGCPNRCRYCYAQSMAHHPGWGRLMFYANSLDLLRRELARRRRAPGLVFFSTCCDPFTPVPQVLDCLHEAVGMLLDAGSLILVSTKCAIPERFVDLFAGRSDRVHVQVGITMADDAVRALVEPGAPPVAERLDTLGRLAAAGVPVEARMDPLIPSLTDAAPAFSSLCSKVAAKGVRDAVASHLFLRPAVERSMRGLKHGGWRFDAMARETYTCAAPASARAARSVCPRPTTAAPNSPSCAA